MPKSKTSVSLSDAGVKILREEAIRLGVTQSAVIEMALRQFKAIVRRQGAEDGKGMAR